MNFEVKKSEIIFKGHVFDIQVDEIEYDSGNKGIREVVLHNGGSVVVPVLENGKIIMITQYRYPFGKFMLELPAGKLEKGEAPLFCAERELTEETGYRSNDFTKLGAIATTPGFCSELLHIYLAENLKPGETNREEGEYGMEVFEFTLDEIDDKIMSGEIFDSKTICGINYYKTLLKKREEG